MLMKTRVASAINRFLDYVFYIYLPACQKRVLDPVLHGRESSCGCWEWNPGPLKEQLELFTAEPSLQSDCFNFVCLLLNISWLLPHIIRILDTQAVGIKRPAWTITCLNKYVIKYEATGSLSG